GLDRPAPARLRRRASQRVADGADGRLADQSEDLGRLAPREVVDDDVAAAAVLLIRNRVDRAAAAGLGAEGVRPMSDARELVARFLDELRLAHRLRLEKSGPQALDQEVGLVGSHRDPLRARRLPLRIAAAELVQAVLHELLRLGWKALDRPRTGAP